MNAVVLADLKDAFVSVEQKEDDDSNTILNNTSWLSQSRMHTNGEKYLTLRKMEPFFWHVFCWPEGI